MEIENIARIAHEVNRAYCESIGDTSQPKWENAPEWQKQSARNGVVFHMENLDAGPEASHENWMKEKIADGWKYGTVKNPDQKIHPCLVPFNCLPQEQKTKDYLFREIVHACL